MTGSPTHRDGVSCRSGDMSYPFGTARGSSWDTFLADFWSLRIFSKGSATMISAGFRAALVMAIGARFGKPMFGARAEQWRWRACGGGHHTRASGLPSLGKRPCGALADLTHDQAAGDTQDHAVRLGASGPREMIAGQKKRPQRSRAEAVSFKCREPPGRLQKPASPKMVPIPVNFGAVCADIPVLGI
jgi:hypothetical protein